MDELVPQRRMPWKWWAVALVIWTGLLVTPGDWFGAAATTKVGEIGLGKLLHVGAYALLAGSAGWLPGSPHRRTAIALGLILHGGLTELIQTQVPARCGCWTDVGIDSVGVLLGWLTTYCWRPV